MHQSSSDDRILLKRCLLSEADIRRGKLVNDKYSQLINRFDLEKASWNTFLRRENKKIKYLPWYDSIIGKKNDEDTYLDDPETIIQIDGPNAEIVDEENDEEVKIFHFGLLLEGHTFIDAGKTMTDFYLYALDKNLHPKEKHNDINPIYESERLENESLDCCAIACRKFFALATHAKQTDTHWLSIFAYSINQLAKNALVVVPIATRENMPHFKKLCWVYGKNLLGLTHDKKLFIIANNKKGIYEQKIPLEIDDIAVNQPDTMHEVLLLAQDKMYLANLARRNAKGAIPYHCIYPTSYCFDDSIQGKMDRIWLNDNEVTVAQLPNSEVVNEAQRFCNFMRIYSEFPILEKVLAHIKPTSVQNKSSDRKNRFLRDALEQEKPDLIESLQILGTMIQEFKDQLRK